MIRVSKGAFPPEAKQIFYTNNIRLPPNPNEPDWLRERERGHTSRMLGMMSRSHCLRKESLSKAGSILRISVSTSDISVFEKSPPDWSFSESIRQPHAPGDNERHGSMLRRCGGGGSSGQRNALQTFFYFCWLKKIMDFLRLNLFSNLLLLCGTLKPPSHRPVRISEVANRSEKSTGINK